RHRHGRLGGVLGRGGRGRRRRGRRRRRLRLERADVAARELRPADAALVGGRAARGIRRVDRRAAGEQRLGVALAAVVAERAQQRVGVPLVARARERAVGGALDVVAAVGEGAVHHAVVLAAADRVGGDDRVLERGLVVDEDAARGVVGGAAR